MKRHVAPALIAGICLMAAVATAGNKTYGDDAGDSEPRRISRTSR